MALRQTSAVRKSTYLNRSVLPHAENGAAIRIPAEVRRELELRAGRGGDSVDLKYDRDECSLTVYFDREIDEE